MITPYITRRRCHFAAPILLASSIFFLASCGSDTSDDNGEEQPTNEDPVFTSGQSATVLEGQIQTGYTATANDPDSDPITFSLSGGADQAAFNIDSSTGVLAFVSAPDFDAPSDANADNDYVVQIQADDGSGGTTQQNLTVTVADNMSPVANAGVDQLVRLGDPVNLDGSDSSDPENDTLTYSWTLDSVPVGSTAVLNGTNSSLPMLTPDVAGDYVALLVVDDGLSTSPPDSVALTAGLLHADYDPLGMFTSCSWTYEWTVGPRTGQQVTTSTGGVEDVIYSSGTITGTIENSASTEDGELTEIVSSNDGQRYRWLRYDDVYISNDCALSAPSENWTFGIVENGEYRTTDANAVDVNNPASCTLVEGALFIDVQDVMVQGTLYTDAVIHWGIDIDEGYDALTLPASLGITAPTSGDLQGNAVTDISIWGAGVGIIAQIGVDAGTGTVPDAYELVAGPTCN